MAREMADILADLQQSQEGFEKRIEVPIRRLRKAAGEPVEERDRMPPPNPGPKERGSASAEG